MTDKRKRIANLLKDDAIGAVLLYQEMTVKDRVDALWYIVDNVGNNNKCDEIVIKDNFTPLLECMKEANTLLETENGYDEDWVNEKAAELYLKRFPEEAEKDELPEEVKEDIKNKFYRLLC
jgi:hypothetical protein